MYIAQAKIVTISAFERFYGPRGSRRPFAGFVFVTLQVIPEQYSCSIPPQQLPRYVRMELTKAMVQPPQMNDSDAGKMTLSAQNATVGPTDVLHHGDRVSLPGQER
jgi:hypothetical protein